MLTEQVLLLAMVGLPFCATMALAIPHWCGFRATERSISRIISVAFGGVALAAAIVATSSAWSGPAIAATYGDWFAAGHYHFQIRLLGDGLSLAFGLLSAVLVGTIGGFSARYLHKEPGFFRFYLLLSLFGAGVELVALAGSLDLVFFGWEIVGLTSALLIAFFHERRNPVEHGLRAFITYRFCDVGLLAAAVWLHHTVGHGTIQSATASPWMGLPVPADPVDATIVGVLLVFATMGKAAQIPLGGWLPRAMEGPTPSSAIFYGAISIHLGPYLLLRAAPLLEAAPVAAILVVLIGSATALHATMVGRVQSDIKSALAYASMTQVGLIFVEVGLGLYYLALVHIIGHAIVRSLQILRSPSLLHDHHHLEQAVGSQLPRTGGHLERWVPRRLQPWLYRLALERGYFDAWLRDAIVGRFLRAMRAIDRAERGWVTWVVGGQVRDVDARAELVEPTPSAAHALARSKEVGS